ncbi:MAG: hypothetical protein ACPGQF_07695, partial [Akkermansiaceae bacterium]
DGSQILEDFSHLNFSTPKNEEPRPIENFVDLSSEENAVLKALSGNDQSIDEIVEKTQLSAHQISVSLMKMELRKLVVSLPGQRFTRKN